MVKINQKGVFFTMRHTCFISLLLFTGIEAHDKKKSNNARFTVNTAIIHTSIRFSQR